MKRTVPTLKVLTLALIVAALNMQPRAQTGERGVSAKPVSVLPARAKRWALVIGVDQYRDKQITQLGGADNDARTLADALVRYAGFSADRVILLSTDQPEERQPTRVNILSRLYKLISLVPKDGLLLVSFAGHGIERNGHAYLLPSDARISDNVSFLEETSISVDRMHEGIRATGVQQVIVLLDACRSDPAAGRAAAPNVLTEAYTRAFDFDVRNREVVAFATFYATAVGQRAYEYGEKRQGYFTWALVEGLKGGAANKKGEVTLNALVEYVQEKVAERTGIDPGIYEQQKPWAEIKGYRAEELILAVAGQTWPSPFETDAAPKPTETTAIEGDSKATDETMKRPRPQIDRDRLRISNAIFDCLASIDPDKGCYLIIGGEGWGDSDVKVIMNGKDVSRQLTSQDRTTITLDGNKETLNFVSGRNEVIVKVGEHASEPYTFIKIIR